MSEQPLTAEETAARALAESRPKKQHGQLCPVWTQRLNKTRHAATIADCDCWILADARLDAAIVLDAARAGVPGDEAEWLRDMYRQAAEWITTVQMHYALGPEATPDDIFMAALREAREEVAALPLYDGTAVTRADSAENVRDRAVAALDTLMGGSPK